MTDTPDPAVRVVGRHVAHAFRASVQTCPVCDEKIADVHFTVVAGDHVASVICWWARSAVVLALLACVLSGVAAWAALDAKACVQRIESRQLAEEK